MVLKSDIGNTFITTIEKDGIEPGTILLETFSSINTIAPKQLTSRTLLTYYTVTNIN